jgi:hypothetical protein
LACAACAFRPTLSERTIDQAGKIGLRLGRHPVKPHKAIELALQIVREASIKQFHCSPAAAHDPACAQ